MVFVRTRSKSGIIVGILLVIIGWAFKAPMLARWVNEGLITGISFLLLFSTVTSLAIGAFLVLQGKRGLVTFLLHIVFATLACISTHFMFFVPLALGIFTAISALLWPASTQQGVVSKPGAEPV